MIFVAVESGDREPARLLPQSQWHQQCWCQAARGQVAAAQEPSAERLSICKAEWGQGDLVSGTAAPQRCSRAASASRTEQGSSWPSGWRHHGAQHCWKWITSAHWWGCYPCNRSRQNCCSPEIARSLLFRFPDWRYHSRAAEVAGWIWAWAAHAHRCYTWHQHCQGASISSQFVLLYSSITNMHGTGVRSWSTGNSMCCAVPADHHII